MQANGLIKQKHMGNKEWKAESKAGNGQERRVKFLRF